MNNSQWYCNKALHLKVKFVGVFFALLVFIMGGVFFCIDESNANTKNVTYQERNNNLKKDLASSEAINPSRVWLKIVKHKHKLYVISGDREIAAFGVAVGRNSGQKIRAGDCRTPEGKFSVQGVQSAQGWSHDFKDGKGVIPNAYGPWFIRLKTGWNGIGIHGTHDPTSIGKNVTEGCIRLKNENLRLLKDKYVKPNMVVIIEK